MIATTHPAAPSCPPVSTHRRLRVLVSAYACAPGRGSEPGVGWGFVSELAKHHDLWVIVEQEEFKNEIERHQKSGLENVRFKYVPRVRNHVRERIWPPAYYWSYRRWHWDAYKLAKCLHQEIGFDLAHQLTMVGFREPGYLWRLGIPFVWGPLGGMGLFPWRFLPTVGLYGALYYLGYNLFNLWQMKVLRRPKRAARTAAKGAASGLIAATPGNRDSVFRYWGCTGTVLTEVGLPGAPVQRIRERAPGEPLRLVWTGLHIPRKALNLALLALGCLRSDVNWELHVLGDGQRTAKWKKLADKLGISARCHFHGWLPREEALVVMQEAHLMTITSLRDLTSTVTVEALALGLPIVCLDHCGFADVVNEQCGVKIPVTTPDEVVAGLARAIERLAHDEDERRALARGAVQRARDFAWDEKARVVDRIYQSKVATFSVSPNACKP